MEKFHKQLKNWVLNRLPDSHLLQDRLNLFQLDGDAGFRRYFRVNTQPPLIAVYAPPQHENNLAFVRVSKSFGSREINVPEIFAINFDKGFMLLQDFGDQVLQPLLNLDTVTYYYGKAEKILLQIQQLEPDKKVYSAYDEEKLGAELELFEQWFVAELLQLNLSDTDLQLLRKLFSLLIGSATEQPTVVVHRDYHSRNLMVENDELCVIDFQDAVVGPITYDLVSLLKDCYIRCPTEIVEQRSLDYKNRLELLGLVQNTTDKKFLRWFDWMGLQRHIKVLGIFARLAIRDNKPSYLKDLPLVIDYVLEAALRYPELSFFHSWFVQNISPRLTVMPWYPHDIDQHEQES